MSAGSAGPTAERLPADCLLVPVGASWCRMVSRRTRGQPPRKRFSITLDVRDYEELLSLAGRHKPPLTLQYVVNYAIQRLLKDAKDPQLGLQLGDPLSRGERV